MSTIFEQPRTATDAALALFTILETGDAALARAVVAPDNHNREAAVSPAACRLPGPAGTLASGAWLRSAFSDLRFPVSETAMSADGTTVWVRMLMQGLHSGPFVRFADGEVDQVLPPSGKRVSFEQIHVVTVRHGLVVRHEAVRDDMTMLGQLGVFPPSPATMSRVVSWKVSGRARRAATEVSALADAAAAGV